MRICIIGPTYPFRGGIAHYSTLLTRELRQWHDVLLVSFTRQYPSWLYPGRSDRDPSAAPLQTEAVYWIDSINPITWWQTARRIDDWPADLVIFQWWVPFWTPQWAMISRYLRAMRPDVPQLAIVHNAQPHERSRLDGRGMRLALREMNGLLCHAESERVHLAAQFEGIPIVVSPHPTYEALGDRVSATTLPVPNKPLLLFCGLVRPYKGVDLFVEALPAVMAEHDVHAAIVGEFMKGSREALLARLDQLRIHDKVTVIDEYVPNELLAAWVARATAVVLPYREATGSGIAQLALGLGTPVVSTYVGGLSELVSHGVDGLLVPPGDVWALRDALDMLLRDGFAERLAVGARDSAEKWSWQRLTHDLLGLLQ